VRYGRGSFHRDRLEGLPPGKTIFGILGLQIRRVAGELARLAVAKLRRSERQAFHHAWALRCDWGYLLEARSAKGRG
jgi:hypothetical protein